ncbi:MAG: hypothetical protein NTZ12_11830 [Candidatus Aminicenantes bacterium]|nr:hypothetical protein [Candidatus Aminicenantes bacterium]
MNSLYFSKAWRCRPRFMVWIAAAALSAVLCWTACDLHRHKDDRRPAPDPDALVANLEADGFIVQEGEMRRIDILKLCSLGYLKYCFGNNAGFPYLAHLLPPAPNQFPSQGQKPPVDFDPNNPDNAVANPDFAPPGISYKLRPDEAIIMVGRTPPHARYFSYRSYVGFVGNKAGKDYSSVFTTGNDTVGYYHRVFASLGDPLNHLTAWTEGTPEGEHGDPFDSVIAVITCSDRKINHRIRRALVPAGYPDSLINDDVIPSSLVGMGLEKGKDTFLFITRASLWEDEAAGKAFLDETQKYVRVFRVTPRLQPPLDPFPVPTLRRRGTGVSEYQIVPDAAAGLESLRAAILARYGAGHDYRELSTDIWLPEGFTGLAQDIDVLAEDRDTTYLKTAGFQFRDDDDFIIVYGINHETTAKGIYCNFSFYGAELLNGVAGANSSMFSGTAADLFPPGYAHSRYYYAYKVARRPATDGEPCVVVPKSTDNPEGHAFGVDNGRDAFIAFRCYIEKPTRIGPAHFELIYDRAIHFQKH